MMIEACTSDYTSTMDTIHVYGDDVMYVKQGVDLGETFFFDFDSKPSVLRLELQGNNIWNDGVCFVNVMLNEEYIVQNSEFWLDSDCESYTVDDCRGMGISFVIEENELPDGNKGKHVI